MLQTDKAMQRGASAQENSHPDMVLVPGGTFRMGSDKHYPEEAPAHRFTVDAFRIDKTPVTNRQFKEFVRATGHVTIAEIVPDPKDYPGALPQMIYAGSLVFTPPDESWRSRVRAPFRSSPCGGKSLDYDSKHCVLQILGSTCDERRLSGAGKAEVTLTSPNRRD
jgi:formylglycine-generating enzyme required for sulfatase activity